MELKIKNFQCSKHGFKKPKVSCPDCFIDKEQIISILERYTNYLVKWKYCDSDVYTEEPRAVDRFIEEEYE